MGGHHRPKRWRQEGVFARRLRTGAAFDQRTYEVERQVRDLCEDERWRIRQEKAAPIIKKFHDWLPKQRASGMTGCYRIGGYSTSGQICFGFTNARSRGALPI